MSSSSNFSSQTLSLGPTWAYPITEFKYFRFGAAFNSSQLLTNSLSSAQQAQQWVQNNGHPYSRLAHDDAVQQRSTCSTARTSTPSRASPAGTGTRATARCSPTAACASRCPAPITHARGDVQYWVANYQFLKYVPLGKHFTLSVLRGRRLRPALGNTTAIPPFRQFFGGGPDTCAASARAAWDRRTSSATPIGGNLRITSQNELIFPMPAKWAQTARVSAFFDMGNVFETGSVSSSTAPTADAGELQVRRLRAA